MNSGDMSVFVPVVCGAIRRAEWRFGACYVAVRRMTTHGCPRPADGPTRSPPCSSPIRLDAEARLGPQSPTHALLFGYPCRYVKPATVTLLSNAMMALGASADTGKIFDFNLTLPIMAGQFLLLMVFLDKTWFSPVGTLLEDRDSQLREKLATVKGNSGEVSNLQEQAEKILSDARAAAQKKVADAKSAVSTEAATELAAAKAKVDAELARALAGLESEKDAALKGLDAQVAKLSDDILARVLPEGVKV